MTTELPDFCNLSTRQVGSAVEHQGYRSTHGLLALEVMQWRAWYERNIIGLVAGAETETATPTLVEDGAAEVPSALAHAQARTH